jgi:hypothetical protein
MDTGHKRDIDVYTSGNLGGQLVYTFRFRVVPFGEEESGVVEQLRQDGQNMEKVNK